MMEIKEFNPNGWDIHVIYYAKHKKYRLAIKQRVLRRFGGDYVTFSFDAQNPQANFVYCQFSKIEVNNALHFTKIKGGSCAQDCRVMGIKLLAGHNEAMLYYERHVQLNNKAYCLFRIERSNEANPHT